MGKPVLTGNKDLNSKKYLDSPKDGFIHKKKNQKFKETPTGKVALINGSKAHSTLSQKLTKQNNGQKKMDYSKDDKKQQQFSKDELKKKSSTLIEEEDDTDSEIEEDINEGVVLKDQSMLDTSDRTEDDESDSDDESEVDTSVPNILGNSLADESDEDDEDYEEEEKVENVQMKKGVKMFKGLKQANSSSDSFNDNSDISGLEESMIEDDDDDDETEDEEEDDEDLEEEEQEDDTLDGSEIEEEEEEDDTDGDEDSEDEEEADESALGLKALVDSTIVDDDEDDEDFVEPGDNDEDDDISDEDEEDEEEEGNNTENNCQKDTNSLDQVKIDKRTVFVGNLPKDVRKIQLKKLFRKFGTIDTIRLRGVISKSLNVPKKVAVMTKEVHPKLKSVYAYVRFSSEESAKAALSMNGTVFEGNYLRVDTADKSERKYDTKKSVFLGNLKFNVDDNTVRKHFEQCGEIESVRVVRDNKTGVGKGFGYVNFKTEDAVALALELDGTTILNREVRVKPNVDQHDKKSKHGKRSRSTESNKNVAHKRPKSNPEVSQSARNKHDASKRTTEKKQNFEKKQTSPRQESSFQGQKADANKKKRKNKLEKKKQVLAEKLTAKTKKPAN